MGVTLDYVANEGINKKATFGLITEKKPIKARVKAFQAKERTNIKVLN